MEKNVSQNLKMAFLLQSNNLKARLNMEFTKQ